VLGKPFVLLKSWNSGISTGYPQAKSLILNRKTTIPEKIPVWNKLYKLGIFVVLLFISTWNRLESKTRKVLLRNHEKELGAFRFQLFQLSSSLIGTWNWQLESLESGRGNHPTLTR